MEFSEPKTPEKNGEEITPFTRNRLCCYVSDNLIFAARKLPEALSPSCPNGSD